MPKVLVIDDEPYALFLLELHLRPRGYDVLVADDGRRGLQLYRQEHPDVILLDLDMPDLDGVSVLKEIRAVDLEQPVIVLTLDSNPKTEQHVRALGGNEFVLKSSSMHLLEDTITRLLQSRKPKFG